ncbi:IclR family transcriptional regulator [Paenibacillus eucommiae]|uniref:DNA-binding IclR family transcriptional regulator n=1 Tax=Paenibacillus eucommiae TaxID=1355755 RepID=A0ABS4J7S8_9BACL|nr:IclR family transcriptional regulator [Paenibacillus eucommiae]MBP1995903.1 DNA-binding IclR family transcriptional regulator [Paenibacillus eucommiae]
MERKYWVPALQKANDILHLIASEPNQLKLIDLSKKLDINKSSMFSLLHTMEELHWVVRDKGDTYALGSYFGLLGGAFFRQFDLISLFHREASQTKIALGETIQLAKLEDGEALYLGKEEAPTPVRLTSEPGMKFPAYSTALGKALLTDHTDAELKQLYKEEKLHALTPYTLTSRNELLEQLAEARMKGYTTDDQESVIGFKCVAVPIRDSQGRVVAAVSCSMPKHAWDSKHELARTEMTKLALRLSQG